MEKIKALAASIVAKAKANPVKAAVVAAVAVAVVAYIVA